MLQESASVRDVTEPKPYRCGAMLTSAGRRGRKCGVRVGSPSERCGKHARQDALSPPAQQVDSELRFLIKRLGKSELSDPRTVLLETVTEAHNMVAVLRQMVQELTDEQLADLGYEGEVRGVGPFQVSTQRAMRAARAKAVLELHGKWTKQAAEIARMTVQAGVEERLVRLAEQQSRIIADVFRAALEDLGLKPAERQRAQEVIAMHLRRLSAPEPVLVGAGKEDSTAHAA